MYHIFPDRTTSQGIWPYAHINHISTRAAHKPMKNPNTKALLANQAKRRKKIEEEQARVHRLLKEGIKTHRTIPTREGIKYTPVSTRLCLGQGAPNDSVDWKPSNARKNKAKQAKPARNKKRNRRRR